MRAFLLAAVLCFPTCASWAGEKNPQAFDIHLASAYQSDFDRFTKLVDEVREHNMNVLREKAAKLASTLRIQKLIYGNKRGLCVLWADEEHVVELQCGPQDEIEVEIHTKKTDLEPTLIPDNTTLYTLARMIYKIEDRVQAAEDMDLLLLAKSPTHVVASRFPD